METEIAAIEFILASTIQVGIAIAGFTGIVLALKSNKSIEPIQKILISILLISSIGSVIFSFIPMLLLSASFDDSSTWVLSSILFLIYFIIILIYRRKQFQKYSMPIPKSIRLLISIFAIAAIFQILNIVYFKKAWPYLFLLIVYILYSFSVFVQLLWLMWERDETTQ